MTAQEAYELALALIDQTEGSETKDYEERAPAIIDVLQREIAFYEGLSITRRIKGMQDALEIGEDTAERILPYGLAASFALSDKNGDMYADYSAMYRSLLRTIRPIEADATDEYGARRACDDTGDAYAAAAALETIAREQRPCFALGRVRCRRAYYRAGYGGLHGFYDTASFGFGRAAGWMADAVAWHQASADRAASRPGRLFRRCAAGVRVQV